MKNQELACWQSKYNGTFHCRFKQHETSRQEFWRVEHSVWNARTIGKVCRKSRIVERISTFKTRTSNFRKAIVT